MHVHHCHHLIHISSCIWPNNHSSHERFAHRNWFPSFDRVYLLNYSWTFRSACDPHAIWTSFAADTFNSVLHMLPFLHTACALCSIAVACSQQTHGLQIPYTKQVFDSVELRIMHSVHDIEIAMPWKSRAFWHHKMRCVFFLAPIVLAGLAGWLGVHITTSGDFVCTTYFVCSAQNPFHSEILPQNSRRTAPTTTTTKIYVIASSYVLLHTWMACVWHL